MIQLNFILKEIAYESGYAIEYNFGCIIYFIQLHFDLIEQFYDLTIFTID